MLRDAVFVSNFLFVILEKMRLRCSNHIVDIFKDK